MALCITEKTNCWDFLKETSLPIFIYGMGDGALKILNIFENYGIPNAGFFASDEFVRGHFFEGHKVHKLSEIEEAVKEFVIVLAFAAGYESLYEKVNEIAKKHILIAPDVPVAGDGLFTYEYFLENEDKFEEVYALLSDEKSKQVFQNIINFKISGKINYLNDSTTPKEEVFSEIIKLSDSEVYADLGAYNGDTVLEFLENTNGNYKYIYAVEPSAKNFKKLQKNTLELENISLSNAAAYSSNGTINFSNNQGRMAKISSASENTIPTISLDSFASKEITLLKLDVEGAERHAILGALKHIENGAKVISALYHRNEDLFDIPLLLHEINPALKFKIRHQLYIPAWETNLYATL